MNKIFWKNKKVLITGHTGFKGSWLCLWLKSMGADVFGYSLAPATSPALFDVLELDKKISSHIGDIRNFEELAKYINSIQPKIIIHMAAQPFVRYSYKFPIETYQTNVLGTVNLLEAARHCASVKVIINVTTDKCYENKEWDWGYRENDALGGHDPYSNSKACSELVTSAYRQSYFRDSQIGIATARAGNVIGGGDWSEDRLIPDIMRTFLKNEKLIVRNPTAIRPWQHVLEPLSGYLLLAEKLWADPKKYVGSWNFGPSDEGAKPVSYIADYFAKQWGNEASWEVDNGQQLHEAQFLKLDISKVKNHLLWQPKWNLEKALDLSASWYRAWAEDQDMGLISLQQISKFETNRK